jgi:predicted nucleic acid-binding protein
MSGSVFVDTNVLVYAHDLDAGEKRERARHWVRELWSSRAGVVSLQVLQEFYVNVTRKIPKALSPKVAKAAVDAYRAWKVSLLEVPDVMRAIDLSEANRLSLWDALIVIAAARARASVLVTEDLNDGQIIEGVRIENPFG